MSTIHLHQTTTLTPEQYIAGLTDFGPGRSKLFGNSADDYLEVHQRGRTQADRRCPQQQSAQRHGQSSSRGFHRITPSRPEAR